MKTMLTLTLLCLIGVTNAQTNNSESLDSTKQMNLLDEQTKIFGQVFELGGMGADNPFGGATNYLQLLDQIEMDPEMKKELRDHYNLYDMSLDPKKKDSLGIAFSQKLQEAMEKSQNDNEN